VLSLLPPKIWKVVVEIRSAFVNHVLGVLLRCSRDKVPRIAARRVVTDVADQQTFWNKSELKLKSDSMGSLVFAKKIKFAIALFRQEPLPHPATIPSS
jgi:hypothetical protein